eukprot:gnl/MRDRNA2_/MRDRNA2_440334_c0_seq1.p1 gnl/MRDRNA2_/MRDRNA2_440334_c0~~gnl/MRDRNA2_/MRDRNA2_440334_c0_seq1.p1  ORF type:complete len:100 (+),score=6.09 gnl/MRDRNA2_/MRDRNA2_440334_c0_seq1:130-429(+)
MKCGVHYATQSGISLGKVKVTNVPCASLATMTCEAQEILWSTMLRVANFSERMKAAQDVVAFQLFIDENDHGNIAMFRGDMWSVLRLLADAAIASSSGS